MSTIVKPGPGHAGIPLDKLKEVAGEKEVWGSLLRILASMNQLQISGRKYMHDITVYIKCAVFFGNGLIKQLDILT